MPTLKWDPNTCGGQYLEDLSTAYWYSEALFTALDWGLFICLEDGSQTAESLAEKLQCDANSLNRYLNLLKTLDLVDCYDGNWYNTTLSSTYLIPGKPLYQGNSIRWRSEIREDWATLKDALKAGRRVHFPSETVTEEEMDARREEYITAMDNVVKLKVPEILEFFGNGLKPNARILDVGAGSGAFALGFLTEFPDTTATLVDIRQVLPQTKKLVMRDPLMQDIANHSRVTFHDQNILEPDWQLEGTYDVIILSNIVHAYAEEEIQGIFETVSQLLSDDGVVLIHDFFLEHWDIKAAFSDINMFINTYNGKVFASSWVRDTLVDKGLAVTPMLPLSTDTAVIFAAKSDTVLNKLTISPIQKLLSPIRDIGFFEVVPFDPSQVVMAPFARNKCSFGCRSGDKKHCAQNHEMSWDETQKMIQSYSKALLLKGEPPTDDFQRKALQAEIKAFKAGYYKAFVFWAGPCSICPDCNLDEPCKNRAHTRPSMEGSGIDVFATVQNAGYTLKTLKERGEVIKYFALLLLE